jgi:hypothetical protein
MSAQTVIEMLDAPAANDGNNTAIDGAFELADSPTIRSTTLATLSAVEQGIADLREAYSGKVYAVSSTKGMAEAVAARLAIRTPRYEISKLVKAKKAELKEAGAALEAEGERIAALLLEIEAPITDQIDAEAVRKKKAKEEAEAKAAAKVLAGQEVIDAIRNRVNLAVGQSPADIKEMMTVLEAIEGSEDLYGTRNGDVLRAKSETMVKLGEMHARQVAWEAQQESLREQQRQAVIQKAIDKFTNATLDAIGKPAATIQALMASVEDIEITEEVFFERQAAALEARTRAITQVESLLANAKAAESSAAAAAKLAAEAADAKAAADAVEAQRVALEAQAAALTAQQAAQDAQAATLQATRTKQIADAILAIEELPDSYTPDMTLSTLRDATEKLRGQVPGISGFGSKVGAARAAHAAALARMDAMLATASARYQAAADALIAKAATQIEPPKAIQAIEQQAAPQVAAAAEYVAAPVLAVPDNAPVGLYDALVALLEIISQSTGVAGYNADGTVAAWDEFEEVTRAKQAVEHIDNHPSNF